MSELKLRGIRKSFAEVDAVRNLNLDIADGEFVSLLGPSGCGKSTTLRVIAGFTGVDEGEIQIGDTLVSAGGERVIVPPNKRDIGLVFQSYALWPHMTVEANVSYGLRARQIPKPDIPGRAREALRMMQMEEYAERYPSELSGGQQQRVSLARAIVYNPRLLLLDEPLSNLDANLRDEMRVEIRQLQQELRFTAVYVTHDQAEAMAMSDRIAVMSKGTIHQLGSPEDIYENPATSFVAGFIGHSNMLPGVARSSASKRGSMRVEILSGVELETRAGTDLSSGQLVAVCIRAENIEVASTASDLPDGVQQLRGTITVALYQGDSWHYHVDADGHTLEVRTSAGMRLNPGEDVVLGVRRADCIATLDVDRQASDVEFQYGAAES